MISCESANQRAASDYVSIKQSLARQHRHDRQAYTDAKAPICWEIIQRADGCAQRIGWEPGPTNA